MDKNSSDLPSCEFQIPGMIAERLGDAFPQAFRRRYPGLPMHLLPCRFENGCHPIQKMGHPSSQLSPQEGEEEQDKDRGGSDHDDPDQGQGSDLGPVMGENPPGEIPGPRMDERVHEKPREEGRQKVKVKNG